MSKKLLRIAFWGSGAERVARQLYYGMRDKETETYYILGRWYQEDVPKEVEVIYKSRLARLVNSKIGKMNHNFLFGTFISRRKIIKFIREKEIDIVHFHSMCGNYIGSRDLTAIKKHCLKIIITMHDMWLLTGCALMGWVAQNGKWKVTAEAAREISA